MTTQEKKRVVALLETTEYLFTENIALKLVLEYSQVAKWEKLLDHLLGDREMLAGVRLKFRDVYKAVNDSNNPGAALDTFLGKLPRPRKTH